MLVSDIGCEFCGEGPNSGVAVFRANEKGVAAIWRCRDHMQGVPIDMIVDKIVTVFEKNR